MDYLYLFGPSKLICRNISAGGMVLECENNFSLVLRILIDAIACDGAAKKRWFQSFFVKIYFTTNQLLSLAFI